MKLMKWDEFKLVPEGTVFQEYELHDLGELCIFGGVESRGNDFVYASLMPVADTQDGFQIRFPSGFGRDGMYDLEKRKWLVWDDIDRARLAGWLEYTAKAIDEQNDEIVILKVPEEME